MSKIGTKVQSLKGQKHMKSNSRAMESSARNLSSGSRVNRPKDDIASWSQGAHLNANIRSKAQASRNASEAISIIQVAGGALEEMTNMITRIRELSVQSANGIYSNQERELFDKEVQQLKDGIDKIARATEFNGQKLLTGEDKTYSVQVDADKGSANTVSFSLVDLSQSIKALGIHDVSIDTQLRSKFSIIKLDFALKEIAQSSAKIGAIQSKFQAVVSKLSTDDTKLKGAKSKLTDADVAMETAKNIQNQATQKAQLMVQNFTNFDSEVTMRLLEEKPRY